MNGGETSRAVMELIIAADRNDRRFEQFAADLFSSRDGIAYQTTAPTGDSGIDARGGTELAGGLAIVCATTQSSGFAAKGRADIDRVFSLSVTIKRLHICFSKQVKEDTLRSLTQYALQKFPNAEVEAHGLSGIVDLGFRYQTPFNNNYARDLDEHTVWLAARTDYEEDDNQINLLRIALTTVFAPEISKQRELITDALIVTSLADGTAKTTSDVNDAVANGLKLERAPRPGYLLNSIESLRRRQLVRESEGRLRLTDQGLQYRDELVEHGTRLSLAGRTAFQLLLGDMPGQLLSAEKFSRLWRVVQARLAKMFLYNGLRVVGELQSLASASEHDGSAVNASLLTRAITDLLDEVATFQFDPRVAQRVAHVLGQILQDRESEAFRWVSELGVKYVVICSLGLDPELERRVCERIATWVIAPDTHVILSYLCAGDEAHEACQILLTQLRDLGAKVLLMQSVLEEAAHHAEIADDNFNAWYERVRSATRLDPAVKPAALLENADNAFVKGFAAAAGARFKPTEWTPYIRQFRGRSSRDIAALVRTLVAELGGEFRPEDAALIETAKAFAQRKMSERRFRANSTDSLKLEWDARLLASAIECQQQDRTNRRCMVLSDSDRLRNLFYRRVSDNNRSRLKISDPAAIACTLAVVPGTSVNLDCVRHFLFSGGVSLSAEVQSKSVLAQVFSDSSRFLRKSALHDRLDDALTADGDRE